MKIPFGGIISRLAFSFCWESGELGEIEKGKGRIPYGGRVVALCRSVEKGKRKEAILSGFFQEGMGLVGDSHAGTDKEVSILLKERVEDLAGKTGFSFPAGAFAENLLVEGLTWAECTLGKRLKAREAILQITQIGKDPAIPHSYNYCGFSLLPRFGIFARVIQSGAVETGDEVEWV